MLDMKYVREHAEEMRAILKHRNKNIDLDQVLALDEEYRTLRMRIDKLRHDQSVASDARDYERAKALKTEIFPLEEKYAEIEKEYLPLADSLPNFISEDTPIGRDEDENVITKVVGTPTTFSFEPRSHDDIGRARGWIDKDLASRVTGARFTYLFGDVVFLQSAIVSYTFDVLRDETILAEIIRTNHLNIPAKAFTPVIPPVMVSWETMQKMGRLEPKDERYVFPDDQLALVGSAEHTLGPIHMDAMLDEKDLPLRYFANTPAFRREAGSYGKDVKGILRMHQFDKIEMETFCVPEQSTDEQGLLVGIQEYLVHSLGLPYQTVAICTGDMGSMDYRQRDIETWIPSQGRYRETHTSDNMTDYQARRLGIRVRRTTGDKQYVHMNDATAFALGRIIIAIIENYQNEDMMVTIPEVLRKYMGGKGKI